jgi:hypothetical protein
MRPLPEDQPSQAAVDELEHYRKTRHAEILKSLATTDPLLAGLLDEQSSRN